jgi:hypothetical protein
MSVTEVTEALVNELAEVSSLLRTQQQSYASMMNAIKADCYSNQDLLLCRDGNEPLQADAEDLVAQRALHVERTHAIFDAIERIVAHNHAIRATLR